MRGHLRTCPSSSSADSRGASTFLRVKNPVVHSKMRWTVHGPSGEPLMGADCTEKGTSRISVRDVAESGSPSPPDILDVPFSSRRLRLSTRNQQDNPGGSMGWCGRPQGVSASRPRGSQLPPGLSRRPGACALRCGANSSTGSGYSHLRWNFVRGAPARNSSSSPASVSSAGKNVYMKSPRVSLIVLFALALPAVARVTTAPATRMVAADADVTITRIDTAATLITGKLKKVGASEMFSKLADQAQIVISPANESVFDDPTLQTAVFSSEWERQPLR